jgi:anhydro-N-acetylmuramic acid kinase
MRDFNVIGVMSGTSLDGVDLVYVNFNYDNKSYEYEDRWIEILRDISSEEILNIKKIDEEYSKKLAEIIEKFIIEFSIKNIDFISSHGHTAIHDPINSVTYQIGNLPILSKKINVDVVLE